MFISHAYTEQGGHLVPIGDPVRICTEEIAIARSVLQFLAVTLHGDQPILWITRHTTVAEPVHSQN
jgi:hypothetical protein